MKKITLIRFKSECGRLFSKKTACLRHEEVCKCWTNPKYRTCKTCKYFRKFIDDNGMDGPYLQKWNSSECTNLEFDWNTMFNPAFDGCNDLCINCEKWEQK